MSRIQLKNVKYAAFASEETHCYEASVYFDGKKVGTVKNDGHGGCDYQYPTDKAGWAKMMKFIEKENELPTIADKGAAMKRYCRQLNEWGDASYWEFQQSDESFYEQYKDDPHGGREGNTLLDSALSFNNKDLEYICGDLVNDYLVSRDLKRALSKKVLFVKDDGNLYETRTAKTKVMLATWMEQIATKHDTRHVLNKLKFEDALEIYKAA